MKDKLLTLGLILLGSIQMIGDLCQVPLLKGIGQATNASPAPKVFTSQKGYETFSKRFFFQISEKNGNLKIIEITPKNYQHLKGPYNRRNMYGAAISYAPVLVKYEKTEPMFNSVADFGLCQPKQSILDEMKIEYDKSKPITLFFQPRNSLDENYEWTQTFTFHCQEATHA